MKPVLMITAPFLISALWTVAASTITMYGLGTAYDVWLPTWQWWGYLASSFPEPEVAAQVSLWVQIGAAGATAITAVLCYRIIGMALSRISGSEVPLFGRSKYATVREGRQSGLVYLWRPRGDCLILGRTKGFLGFWRYVCLPGISKKMKFAVEHVMLYAKTRSGKGVAYVITNCFNYAYSLVVLDIKSENFKITAWYRKYILGHKVYRFSPLDENGLTHCWNPLGDIDVSQPDYISKLQRRAFNLFPEVEGKDRFWQDGARSAFLGAAVLVCESPDLALNPSTVFRFFTRGDGAEELRRRILERRTAGNPYSQTCVDLISDYLNGVDEVVKGIRKHITATMGLWFNPKIAAATARSDFSLSDLRRDKITVYIGVMPADLEQLGILLRLFFLQLFEANTDRMPEDDETIIHPAHVIWDEFTAIPAMKAIAKAAGFSLGFWLHFSFIVQSKNQVKEEYKGQGAASLLENIGAEIVFGSNNLELCKEVSERAGDDTVSNVSRSAPRFFSLFRPSEQQESEGQAKRPLILPQEVAQLPKDEELMFRSTVAPFHLKRTKWFTDRNFRNRVGDPDYPAEVVYSISRDDGSISFEKEEEDRNAA
jgi:type IV secretion system protein VirD4